MVITVKKKLLSKKGLAFPNDDRQLRLGLVLRQVHGLTAAYMKHSVEIKRKTTSWRRPSV